jgi:hypothetical protein
MDQRPLRRVPDRGCHLDSEAERLSRGVASRLTKSSFPFHEIDGGCFDNLGRQLKFYSQDTMDQGSIVLTGISIGN